MEIHDGFFLPRFQPKIAGDPPIMFVHATVTRSPVVELAGAHTQPVNESSDAELGLFHPTPDEIHYQVPHIVRHPHFAQSSPRLFLTRYARPSVRPAPRLWVWIFFSRKLLPWKTAAPFSKNSFCQR